MDFHFFNLAFFKFSQDRFDNICADDFKNNIVCGTINLEYILSISNPHTFKLPFSGDTVGLYAIVTMKNDDKYYINENTHSILLQTILKR